MLFRLGSHIHPLTGLPQARPHPSKAVERTWVRLAALSLCRREDGFGYGAQALVVQGRPPVDGVGEVFDFAGRGSETSRSLSRCDQAHGVAARPVAEIEARQEGLTAAPKFAPELQTNQRQPVRFSEQDLLSRRSPRRGTQFQSRDVDVAISNIAFLALKIWATRPPGAGSITQAGINSAKSDSSNVRPCLTRLLLLLDVRLTKTRVIGETAALTI